MHFVLHIIHPADVDDVYDYIAEKMHPFSEEFEVPEYKDYYSEKEIASAQKWYSEKGYHDGDDPSDTVPFSWDNSTTYVDEKGAYKLSTRNPQGYWDWWVIGGRWDNYWNLEDENAPSTDRVNNVSVGYAILMKFSGKYDWMQNGPYAYMTLEGKFIEKQSYNKDGDSYPNPEYDYWDYLLSVEAIENIAITVVDYHC